MIHDYTESIWFVKLYTSGNLYLHFLLDVGKTVEIRQKTGVLLWYRATTDTNQLQYVFSSNQKEIWPNTNFVHWYM